MTKIIINGCSGRMGRVISRLVSEREDCVVVAGVDKAGTEAADYEVFEDINDFDGDADVLIDFSHPSALSGVLSYCKKRKIPAVIATTGLSDEQKNELLAASETIGIFFSANMSLGINLITDFAKKAARLLEDNFDIEIIEKHHNKKLDAPSGTALAIADAISETLSSPSEYVYDRSGVRKARSKNEIGIHAVRGGTIVGEHSVIFAGPDEVIEIKHQAASREVFAAGAVKAAVFMSEKGKGMYSMTELINSL